MKRPISLTARMSLLFALSAAAILLVAGILFVRAANDHFLDNDRQELDGKIALIGHILEAARSAQDLAGLPARVRDTASGHPGIAVLVEVGDQWLFSTGDQQILAYLARGAEIGGSVPVARQFGDRVYRIAGSRFALDVPGRPSATVAIALDISEDQAFLRQFEEFLWFGIFLAGLALGWLGWVVAQHGLSPLREVSAQIAEISAQGLDQPLDTTLVPRELEGLMAAFNIMLARLNDSFRRLTEFSDDLAHEVRTPINNLLLQTQVTLDGEASLEVYRAALQANEVECQNLSRMISDMLFLAKAGNKLVLPEKEELDLAVEVAALFDFYEGLASECGVRLEQHGAACLDADRRMMRRALSNLLANALRYTAPGLAIRVDIATPAAGWLSLAVSNPGPEIPAEQRERIFERLYQIDPSRQAGPGDHIGLGLAITKSIVELHGGSIKVQYANGENSFVLHLPCQRG